MLRMGSEHDRRKKIQALGRYSKARVRSGRFRGSLSVALIIISLRERETLIGMAYPPTFFMREGEGNSFRFKVAV